MAPGSSVRVEFEDSTLNAGTEPEVGAPNPNPPNRRLAVVGAVVVALVLVVGLLSFRPSEGETAAGTERAAPTTTVAPATTTSVTPSTTTTTRVEAAPLAPVNAFFESDVVRGEVGFLALLDSTSDNDFAPSLYHSNNGLEWELVDTELAPFVAKGDDITVEYSHLISSGEGFGLLRTRTVVDRLNPTFPAASVTERLVSIDGQRWARDEGFTSLLHNELARPTFHVADSFGFITDEVIARASAGDCEGQAEEAADRFGERSLLIHRLGQSEPEEIQVSLSAGHTRLSNASVASFVPNGLEFEAPFVCQRFPGINPEFPAPTVQLIAADNAVRQIGLPAEVTEGGLANSPDVSLVETEAGLVVVLDRSIWLLDTESEEWTRLLEIPVGPLNILDYQVIDSGDVVALLSADAAVIIDPATAESRSVNLAGTTGLPIILYADDELVVTPGALREDATRTVPLTNPQPIRGTFPGEAAE